MGSPPTPPSRPAEPLFDRARALAFLEGSEELFQEAGRETLTEVPRQEARVRAALAAGDAAGVHRAAHALKGTLGLMGGAGAARSADLLQQAAAAGDPIAVSRRADELHVVLELYLADLAAALDGRAGG